MLDHESDRLVKHITEAFRLGRFSCVPSVARLVDVRLQVLIAHVVVATVNHSSEMAPEPLNAVGEHIAIGVHLRTVSEKRLSNSEDAFIDTDSFVFPHAKILCFFELRNTLSIF